MHNGGNLSSDCTILGPAICTLLAQHIKICVETRVENKKHGQHAHQAQNQVDVG